MRCPRTPSVERHELQLLDGPSKGVRGWRLRSDMSGCARQALAHSSWRRNQFRIEVTKYYDRRAHCNGPHLCAEFVQQALPSPQVVFLGERGLPNELVTAEDLHSDVGNGNLDPKKPTPYDFVVFDLRLLELRVDQDHYSIRSVMSRRDNGGPPTDTELTGLRPVKLLEAYHVVVTGSGPKVSLELHVAYVHDLESGRGSPRGDHRSWSSGLVRLRGDNRLVLCPRRPEEPPPIPRVTVLASLSLGPFPGLFACTQVEGVVTARQSCRSRHPRDGKATKKQNK